MHAFRRILTVSYLNQGAGNDADHVVEETGSGDTDGDNVAVAENFDSGDGADGGLYLGARAKVPETEKAKWGKMIERYLHTSQTLKAVFLLIDIRHDPSANDKLMYDWIVNNGYNPIIIATKLDKLKRSQVQKNIKAIKDGLKLRPGSKIIPFSAETKQGKDEIWALMDELTGAVPAATDELKA